MTEPLASCLLVLGVLAAVLLAAFAALFLTERRKTKRGRRNGGSGARTGKEKRSREQG